MKKEEEEVEEQETKGLGEMTEAEKNDEELYGKMVEFNNRHRRLEQDKEFMIRLDTEFKKSMELADLNLREYELILKYDDDHMLKNSKEWKDYLVDRMGFNIKTTKLEQEHMVGSYETATKTKAKIIDVNQKQEAILMKRIKELKRKGAKLPKPLPEGAYTQEDFQGMVEEE